MTKQIKNPHLLVAKSAKKLASSLQVHLKFPTVWQTVFSKQRVLPVL